MMRVLFLEIGFLVMEICSFSIESRFERVKIRILVRVIII
jgi:hypothetical protein